MIPALRGLSRGLAVLCAIVAAAPAWAGDNFLKGKLLVATDAMRDPRFAESVILMVEHDASGAYGVIVNKPIGEGPLSKLLDGIGAKPVETEARVTLYYGGPVELGAGAILHSDDYRRDGTKLLGGGIAMSRDPETLGDVARGKGPKRLKVVMGYAGWAPGQLEAEISRGDWTSATADAALIFDNDTGSVWPRAGKGAGVPL